jgi:hypothetical protein
MFKQEVHSLFEEEKEPSKKQRDLMIMGNTLKREPNSPPSSHIYYDLMEKEDFVSMFLSAKTEPLDSLSKLGSLDDESIKSDKQQNEAE